MKKKDKLRHFIAFPWRERNSISKTLKLIGSGITFTIFSVNVNITYVINLIRFLKLHNFSNVSQA